MGNVAIAFIESTISFSARVEVNRQKRIEHKRIRSLIPRYLARLNNSDMSITTLNLNGLGVDSKILRLLSSPLLSGRTRVQELYLEHNWIGVEGATCIARILSKDNHLKNVSLAHNPVGSVGVMAIASALEQNTSLERLDLSHCDIDDDGIRKLAHSLKSNKSLKYCNLEGNYISSSGVYSLLRCVYDTTSMQSLWESNHSLRAFYGQRSIYSLSFPETAIANRELVRQLGEILATCNRRYSTPNNFSASSYKMSARIAACKILRHYVKEDSLEYWECVEGMEEKLVPNVIGWLVRYGGVGVIYGVVRDMPWLLEKKADKKGSREGNYALVDKKESMVDELMVNNRMEDPPVLQ
ncbi:hypothetical protein ACHAXR_011557 [Thalassiosira sp. AJA248-18]